MIALTFLFAIFCLTDILSGDTAKVESKQKTNGLITQWFTSDVTLPRADVDFGGTYDPSTHYIWIIGGWVYPNQLIKLDLNNFTLTDYGEEGLGSSSLAFSFNQVNSYIIDKYLYVLLPFNGGLGRLNLKTVEWEQPWKNITNTIEVENGCLVGDSKIGVIWAITSYNITEFDINSGISTTYSKQPNYLHALPSCIKIGDYIYIISTSRYIERINYLHMNDGWEAFDTSFEKIRRDLVCPSYEYISNTGIVSLVFNDAETNTIKHYIYIVGGICYTTNAINDVTYFSVDNITRSKAIEIFQGESLPYKVFGGLTVTDSNRIYVIGGGNGTGSYYYDSILYSNIASTRS